MVKNYIKIALRNLVRHGTYSAVNIFGLTLGVVCFTFIYLFVSHELSFDEFHEKKESIYTVPFTWHFGTTDLPTSRATSNVGPLLADQYDEVLEFNRIKAVSTTQLLKSDAVTADQEGFFYTDSTFFKLFSFNLLVGNPEQVLVKPRSVVLSESVAGKYFGQNWQAMNPVGKTIQVGTTGDYQITGIVENAPDNSHIQYQVLASFSSLPESEFRDQFDNSAYLTYVLVDKNTNMQNLQKRVDSDLMDRFNGELPIELSFRKLEEIYLYSGMGTGVGPVSDIQLIYIISIIGVLIILIACINYVNLATARSVERAREVGVRKVMGALKRQLEGQFMGESAVIALVSILLASLLIALLLPIFNALALKSFELGIVFNAKLVFMLTLIWMLVTITAGLYPAVAMASLPSVQVLKGSYKSSSRGIVLRKALVVFQFAITLVLIVATVVINKQIRFVKSKDIGYEASQIMAISLDSKSTEKIDQLKNSISNLANVYEVTASSFLPSNIRFETTFAKEKGEENRQLIRAGAIDLNFAKTLGLKFIAGNEGSADQDGTYQFVINRSAAEFFMWKPEEAIGQDLLIWNSDWGKIVGVVDDFHFSSLHEKIQPLILYRNTEDSRYLRQLLVKFNTSNLSQTTSQIKDKWDAVIDHKPFDYEFLEDDFQTAYKKEEHIANLATTFSVLALLIGSLGLFGLASYSTNQRSKEIGIRKVLGASSFNIIIMLSRQFVNEIIISAVIGIPLAYYFMNSWLTRFEYKIEIGLQTGVIAFVLIALIGWMTTASRALKTASTNPTDILRSE